MKMILTWLEIRKRRDIVGGHLEVFEDRENSFLNFRGQIEKVIWNEGLPTFILSHEEDWNFQQKAWIRVPAQPVTVERGVGGNAFVFGKGKNLFATSWNTRYFIVPKGIAVPPEPILKPVSYEELTQIILSSFLQERSIISFK